ncbi:helix-turn-helix transcriptional regulator [Actinocrinis puniceicyclus]|uniref:Helix-turn-helix transcriptional regulator n=1 Tax=Actinocrinis puniceicyclus TaxID=977794 RepID=A0A8J8BBT7_9ACTN|nr:TetR/AcrR family transcriptional regulator [Actinocrinis puniceicyclus]MBS2964402.1 helix-turn-helix transcriptional regulator [Actinocrinis puniceicyclus]
MENERSTAARRRAQAVASAMRVFADQGLTTSAVQQIADEIGVSQPYVFRLFGSKQALFLACLDELVERVCVVFRAAAAASPADPLLAMGEGFRDLVSDGVVSGLWLQACAAARRDEVVARRCRSALAEVLAQADTLTRAGSGELAGFLADGSLVMLLQALGMDLSGGTRAAVDSLRMERTSA